MTKTHRSTISNPAAFPMMATAALFDPGAMAAACRQVMEIATASSRILLDGSQIVARSQATAFDHGTRQLLDGLDGMTDRHGSAIGEGMKPLASSVASAITGLRQYCEMVSTTYRQTVETMTRNAAGVIDRMQADMSGAVDHLATSMDSLHNH